MKAILTIVALFSTLSSNAAENATGATGCSHEWNLRGLCWRFCAGSEGDWCYTGSGCLHNSDACNNTEVCTNEDCAGRQSCVRQCSAASAVEPTSMPSGATGCKNRLYRSYCWRYCRGSSGKWCYTSYQAVCSDEDCAYKTECGRIDCWGQEDCVAECGNCASSPGLSPVPETALDEEDQCKASLDEPISSNSVFRTGPENQEYVFFTTAFVLLDRFCKTRLTTQFEYEITRAGTGFLVWKNITDLRVQYDRFRGYFQAISNTQSFIAGALPVTKMPTESKSIMQLRTLYRMADDVFAHKKKQIYGNPHSSPSCVLAHERILDQWADMVTFLEMQVEQ